MEKLQAALEMARRKRAEGGAPDAVERPQAPLAGHSAAVPGKAPASHAPTGLDALWSSLPEAEINQKAMIQSRILSRQASVESTPFDVLRTKILFQMRQSGWRRLAITSPLPRCGKTTIATNLAIGLGRQPELRTILFDFDLRDPSVANKLGIAQPPAMAPLLRGERPFADHACRIGPNLALALSGVPDPDPTRLLMSDSTRRTLAAVQADYEPDIIIFDLPSILIGDDARAFLQHVDCALIVARAEQTRYGDFDSCEREVAEYTNVLGVVLNGYRQDKGVKQARELLE